MSARRKPLERRVLVERVNFWWYLAPIVPILALLYAGIVGWLPQWAALFALFGLFMWLFSLIFTTYALMRRRLREKRY